MISRNRLNKIKKALIKDLDKLVIIKFSDGSELKVTGATINESFANYDKGTEFTRVIKDKEIVSCSDHGKLIHVIQQLREG